MPPICRSFPSQSIHDWVPFELLQATVPRSPIWSLDTKTVEHKNTKLAKSHPNYPSMSQFSGCFFSVYLQSYDPQYLQSYQPDLGLVPSSASSHARHFQLVPLGDSVRVSSLGRWVEIPMGDRFPSYKPLVTHASSMDILWKCQSKT